MRNNHDSDTPPTTSNSSTQVVTETTLNTGDDDLMASVALEDAGDETTGHSFKTATVTAGTTRPFRAGRH